MSDAQTLTMADVLADIRELPSLPSAVDALIAALDDDTINIDALAHDIAKDQALSARALRVANSPFYGVQHKVASIHDAIVVLGLKAVGSLIMAASVSSHLKPRADSGFDLSRFWRHSIGTALCARALARRARLAPEIGFTAGLLHDIGLLLLATTRPEHFGRIMAWRDEQDCLTHTAEHHVLGFDHAAIGAALAERWHFPPVIVRAVAHHHHLEDDVKATMADVVHVANALARALDLGGEPNALVPPLDAGAWHRLDLSEAAVSALLAKIEREHESYCTLLATA